MKLCIYSLIYTLCALLNLKTNSAIENSLPADYSIAYLFTTHVK